MRPVVIENSVTDSPFAEPRRIHERETSILSLACLANISDVRPSADVHRAPEEAELAAIRRSNETGLRFGGCRWVEKLCRRLHLDLTIRPRGRPRKDAPGGYKIVLTPFFFSFLLSLLDNRGMTYGVRIMTARYRTMWAHFFASYSPSLAIAIVAIAIGATGCAPGPLVTLSQSSRAAQQEMKKFAGRWRYEVHEVGQQDSFPSYEVVTFAGGQMIFDDLEHDRRSIRTFSIDPTQTPPWMDINGLPCAYRFESENELRVAIPNDATRPTSLDDHSRLARIYIFRRIDAKTAP